MNNRDKQQEATKERRAYLNLLKALAEYVKLNKDENLEAFLSGYVPEDWQEAKGESDARI